MAVTVLIHAFSPINAISAICAVLACHPTEDVNIVILHYWPGVSDEMARELTEIITKMFSGESCVKRVVSLSQQKHDSLLAVKRIQDIRNFIISLTSLISVDEIYYAHNVVGEVYPLLTTIYPKARRINYGDAMGQVVDKMVHLGYLLQRSKSASYIYRCISFAIARAKMVFSIILSTFHEKATEERLIRFKDCPADAAALIIPVDQTGKTLKDIPVTVCPRKRVLEIFDQCSKSCSELQNYIRVVLEKHQGKICYLLLTENSAEGNFIAFDREIEMYSSIIREHCQPGSVIFLKSHPGETLPRNERLSQSLSGEYVVLELDAKYKRYPIELWKEFVTSCKIICLSYPTLSLKYLYNIDVIQPMDDAFIEHWFPEWTWASYKNAIVLYMEPLKRLSGWDGNSILWDPTK